MNIPTLSLDSAEAGNAQHFIDKRLEEIQRIRREIAHIEAMYLMKGYAFKLGYCRYE